MTETMTIIPADDIALSIASSIAALVGADDRNQVEIAELAWADLSPESGRRRLQRLMRGDLWPTRRDVAGLASALGCDWRTIYGTCAASRPDLKT